jgi:DNA-binding response OmpR family regulator
MRILIVEDDRDARNMLQILLEMEGHEVVVATNGEEGWSAFERGGFSVVLSDWLMPEVDGLELCRRIRGSDKAKYVYIILVTALQGKSHYLEGMAAGADDFVTKPYDPDELRARLIVAERIVHLQDRVKRLEIARKSATSARSGSASSNTSPSVQKPRSAMAFAPIATRTS